MTQPIRIVHIEPNEADAKWLDITLRECGVPYELHTFSTVVEAAPQLRADDQFRCDLLVVNCRLPFLELREAVSTLRAIPVIAGARLAITMVSAHERLVSDDVDCCLMKPVDVEQLRPLLLVAREMRGRAGATDLHQSPR